MQVKTEFSFTGILESVRLNLLTTAVFLPHHIIAELPKGRIRASGSINGANFSLAIQFRREGGRFFSVGSALRKAANIKPGDTVRVNFRVLDLENVELPDLREVIVMEDAELKTLGKIFQEPTRHPLNDYLLAVRNMDVRMRKAIERVKHARIKSLETPSPKKKRKSSHAQKKKNK